jgi:ADP-ribose pyrophosphatase YjhB (NUDIX family)
VTCPRCGTRHWRNAKPCAGALVVREGRLLLVRRAISPWHDHWDIPGGFCDPDEHPAAAAVREVREETGLDVRVTGLLGIWMDRYPDGARGADTTLNCYYHAEPRDARPARADPAEASEIGWFAPDAIPARIAFPGHAGQVLAAWAGAMASGSGEGAGA